MFKMLINVISGDYDGDIGLAIWQPEIVQPFQNADLIYSVEPPEVAACFSRNNEKVSDFLQRMESETPSSMNRALQQVLFERLRHMAITGMYSTFQDNAIYTLGYCHPESVRLGYMWVFLLGPAKLFEYLKGSLGFARSWMGPKLD
jgi:hypothetical protein